MRFFLSRRKENGMTKKERARRLTYEALVILGVLALLLYLCRLWPLLLLTLLGIFLAAARLLVLSAATVRPVETQPPPSGRERREDRPENREFGNLQVQITRQVEADYPGARWVWKDPNPTEKFLQGDTLGILLNRAGGYREAALRLEGHTLSSVQYLGAPAEKLRLPQQEEAGEVLELSPKPEPPQPADTSALAFQWVESHWEELDALCNECIAQGQDFLLISGGELPEPAAWPALCKELCSWGLSCTLREDGVQINFKREDRRKE